MMPMTNGKDEVALAISKEMQRGNELESQAMTMLAIDNLKGNKNATPKR
jgi:hypothetical protein